MFRNLSVVKIYMIRPKPGPICEKCNSKALRLGIETRVLWVTRAVLYH